MEAKDTFIELKSPRFLVPSAYQAAPKSSRKRQLQELEALLIENDKKYEPIQKRKPSKRGWRFAYDMYCRELMMNHHVMGRKDKS